MPKIAVIGGTSLLKSNVFSHLKAQTVETPHGNVVLYTDGEDAHLIFLQRHHADGDAGAEVYYPPHRINHRANLHALSKLKVDVVLAVCSVGSLKPAIKVGTLILPADYFYMFGPSFSYYDDVRGHIVPTIDKGLRDILRECYLQPGFAPLTTVINVDELVYVQTVGPRFETCAEVKFLSHCGDVVGMTAANEATCAKELNLRYAILAMVDNMGNGLTSSTLTTDEFLAAVAANQTVVENSVNVVIKRLQQLNHTSF